MTREELRSASKPPASTASRTQGGTRYCLDRGALCARGAAQGRLAAVHSQGAVKSNLRVLTTQHVASGPSSHMLKVRHDSLVVAHLLAHRHTDSPYTALLCARAAPRAAPRAGGGPITIQRLC
jgi:hypothetical protein